jgi:hypothetical protein
MTDTATRGETERSGDAGGGDAPRPSPRHRRRSFPSADPATAPRAARSSRWSCSASQRGRARGSPPHSRRPTGRSPSRRSSRCGDRRRLPVETPLVDPAEVPVPGTLFLLVFALYPVIYLVYISTTNYGTGNNLTKDQAIEQIESNSISASDDAIRYDLQILAQGDPGGELAFLLTDPTATSSSAPPTTSCPLAPDDIVEQGTRERRRLRGAQRSARRTTDRPRSARSWCPRAPRARSQRRFGTAFAKQQTRVYDPATDTITDTVTDTVYTADGGYFVDDDGDRLLPGWRDQRRPRQLRAPVHRSEHCATRSSACSSGRSCSR